MQLVRRKKPDGYFRRLPRLKKLFWLYFLLLIFEGALRKWVVPQLSAPLLIIRDPVSVLIIWEAYRTHKWPARWSSAMAFLTLLLMGLFAAQLIAGDNLLSELFGLRTYLLPFPVLFIMGENLDKEDLHKLGVATLWLLLPMSLIEVGQFVTPPGSFLNKGAYLGGAQIAYVSAAHVRASGTFSFVVGAEEYAVLAAAFLLYGMIKDGFAKKWLLWAGAFALLLSLPMMGSRTMVYQLAAMLGCAGVAAMMGISQFTKTLRVAVPVLMVSLLVTRLPVFTNANGDLNARIVAPEEGAAGGNIAETAFNNGVYRIFTPIVATLENPIYTQDLLGIGMGQGAVAVNVLLRGSVEGKAGEGEFSREFREMGAFAGSLFAIFKVFLTILLLGQAVKMARDGEALALLFIPLALILLNIAQLEQPTEQGFMVIGMAFCMAAAKSPARAGLRAPMPMQRPPMPLHRRRLRV